MIFIDPAQVDAAIPNEWKTNAAARRAELEPLADDAKAAYIDGHSIWQDIREILSGVSHGKCWYCESKNLRAHNAVDHYRPKGAVYERADHSGYWWLAFALTNYCFCCQYCNEFGRKHRNPEGGKRTHFPLENEDRRAMTPADNLNHEQPLLVNPTVREDPALLWFNEEGRCVPHPRLCANHGAYNFRRADRSIAIYNLDEQRLREARLAAIETVNRKIDEATAFWHLVDEADNTAKNAFRQKLQDLLREIQTDQEFSSAKRAAMDRRRGEPLVDIALSQL